MDKGRLKSKTKCLFKNEKHERTEIFLDGFLRMLVRTVFYIWFMLQVLDSLMAVSLDRGQSKLHPITLCCSFASCFYICCDVFFRAERFSTLAFAAIITVHEGSTTTSACMRTSEFLHFYLSAELRLASSLHMKS